MTACQACTDRDMNGTAGRLLDGQDGRNAGRQRDIQGRNIHPGTPSRRLFPDLLPAGFTLKAEHVGIGENDQNEQK